MLRAYFGMERRKDSGILLEAFTEIKKSIAVFRDGTCVRPERKHRLELWSQTFLDALDELEQSKFCAIEYGGRVSKKFPDEMSQEELDDYHRHVYFYKNAIIRLFSILDKMGQLMNDVFYLETEKLKPKFSFFTVLRRMHERQVHVKLEVKLYKLKEESGTAMDRLRKLRNMEIHSINAELLDELLQNNPELFTRLQVENIQQNLSDLEIAYQMVCTSVKEIYSYIRNELENDRLSC